MLENRTDGVAVFPRYGFDEVDRLAPVTLPLQTVANTVDQFLDELEEEAQSHAAVRHPYLTALSRGHLPNPPAALRDFAANYGCYCRDFTRYLCLTIARLETPAHQALLTENFLEESGAVEDDKQEILGDHGIELAWIDGVPHKELYRRFQNAVGVHPGDSYCIEAEIWRATFLDLLNTADAARAVGAIGLGTEGVVRAMYQPLAEACQHYPGLTRQQAVFFELHCLVDDDHAEALRQIACDLGQTTSGRANLRLGMHQALGLRATFWEAMYRRALAMEVVQ